MSVKVNIFIIYSIILLIFYHPIMLLASPQFDYIINGDRIDKALNNLTGDPYNGRELVRNPSKGNCLVKFKITDTENKTVLQMQPRNSAVDPAAFIRELKSMPQIEYKLN